MIVKEIFEITMALIDEMSENGTLDEATTAEYKAKTPPILTTLQAEIVGIENRYRDESEQVFPIPIKSLEQTVSVDTVKAYTLLPFGLAASLLLHENKSVAAFFQQRYEELKGVFLKSSPRTFEKIEDVYDSSLTY